MKIVAALALASTASAFAPVANNARQSVAMQAENSRREALSSIAAAGAVFLPAAANAAAGESPRFSVFGLVGDGTSYSEGAAYGTDQAATTYSPYSVYGNVGADDALYKGGDADVNGIARKKAFIAESQKRLSYLPGYVEKKQWFNVKDELTRYMYETRGAVRGLAKTPEQKKLAKEFFQAIEEASLQATLKNQDKCAAASAASASTLDAFVASL
jgi:photosystem II oxygen-evolving enhancer protein 3